MKHSQFDAFSYNDFTKEEIYNLLVEVQDELINSKNENIKDVRNLLLEKQKNKALNIEVEILKRKIKKQKKSKPIADFKSNKDFNYSSRNVKKREFLKSHITNGYNDSHKIGEDYYKYKEGLNKYTGENEEIPF